MSDDGVDYFRTFDDVVCDWMRDNPETIREVTDRLYGFDDSDNITNDAVERFVRDILDRGLQDMVRDAEMTENCKEASE